MIGKLLSLAVLSVTLGAGTARAETPERVLVIPFTTLNVPESQQWMAKGVQENLVADFGRAGAYMPVAFQGQVVVEDNATAVRLARQASAGLAVRGAAQVVGGTVRLTAQLIDARSGDTISTASVTGSPNDLLKLEDDLSAQLRTGPAAPAAPAVPVATEATPPEVIVVQSSPALGYDPSYYTGGYWNNGLIGYPGVYWPVVVPLPRHDRHDRRDRDDCDPPPRQHHPVRPEPKPIHALPRDQRSVQSAGFSLPIPQSGGFSLPVPTGGFALPIPQSGTIRLQPTSPSRSWYSPPVMIPQAPRPTPTLSVPRMGPPTLSAPRMQTPRSMAPGGIQFINYQ